MPIALPYTDDDLAAAIAAAHSWRGVLRALGKPATSAGSFRSARRRADALGLDYAHFTGQRRWSDAQLALAVARSRTWQDVVNELGLSASGYATAQAHAVRLALDTSHLQRERPTASDGFGQVAYDPAHLRSSGSLFAACWFTLRGIRVSWPLEPCRYDLAAEIDGAFRRVQVKTTMGCGSSVDITLSSSRRGGATVYAPDEIDYYFLLDGELSAYLIPYEVVAGFRALRLGHYVNFKVCDRGQLLSEACAPAP